MQRPNDPGLGRPSGTARPALGSLVALCLCAHGLVGCEPAALEVGAASGRADAATDARPSDDAQTQAPTDAGARPDDAREGEPDALGPGDAEAPPLDGGAPPPPDAVPDPDAAPPPPPDAAPPPTGPVVYPPDRLVSPLTEDLARDLRALAARAPDRAPDVFAKIGDSLTVANGFLRCFGGDRVDLGGRDALGSTLALFQGGDAAGTNPFERESQAAVVGWSVRSAIAGDPSPVEREVAALNPRYAVVMYGTNDIQSRNIFAYADGMRTLVDGLLAGGVLPILSSLPPRDDDAEADAWVPRYSAVVRGLAQSRGVPFVDLTQALLPLPEHGLGPDDLHASSFRGGACVLTEEGLQHGYNWRNLLTLTALDRLVRALDAEPAPDAAAPRRRGAGGPVDPIVLDGFPFTDVRDTRVAPDSALDAYPGCNAPANESGPEVVYRLDLVAPTTVHAFLFDDAATDVDLHLLADPTDPGTCLARHDRELTVALEAGTWYLVADTYVSGGGPEPGEFMLVVLAE